MTHNASCDVSNCDHTTTPWYVTLIDEYNEIHIQSAPEESDNHVLSIHYKGEEGLRQAMANAKLIVESVNDKTFGGQLLVNQTLFDEVGV